jgi:hypothetical protein
MQAQLEVEAQSALMDRRGTVGVVHGPDVWSMVWIGKRDEGSACLHWYGMR